jgi:hypothetical protein
MIANSKELKERALNMSIQSVQLPPIYTNLYKFQCILLDESMTDEDNVKFIMEFIKENRDLAFYQIDISILIRPKLHESYLNILLRLSDDDLNQFFVTSQVPDPIFTAIYNTGRVTKIRIAPKISGVFTHKMLSPKSSPVCSHIFKRSARE